MKRIVITFLIILLPVCHAESQSRKVKQAIKKQEQKENAQQKNYEKVRKTTLKHRYEIQTREVQERMKESQKKSDAYNNQRKQPFYKELFNRKKRKKR